MRRRLPPRVQHDAAAHRLRAILPVHAFGQPADLDPILEVAARYDLSVIEDACEALGAEYKGRRVGALAGAGCFAFYPNKQMTTTEGGLIVTNDDIWDALFRSLRNQGRDDSGSWLRHVRLGYNYRLGEMACALGVAQMSRLDELLAKRARVAAWYGQRLAVLEHVTAPPMAATTTRMSWFVYVVRFSDADRRRRVIDHLAARGIPSRTYFPPIHLQPLYVERFGYEPGSFPVTEALGETCLALPFSSVMTEAQVDEVTGEIGAALHGL
jgi:dTDP-4-amino-4,6-dideoxygalactose transaminase